MDLLGLVSLNFILLLKLPILNPPSYRFQPKFMYVHLPSSDPNVLDTDLVSASQPSYITLCLSSLKHTR